MVKGGDAFARGRIPEPGGVIYVRRQDPSAVRTKRPVDDTCNLGIGQGGDQLARSRIPELGGCIPARREDPSTIRTERRVGDLRLMVKGGDKLARGGRPELGGGKRVSLGGRRIIKKKSRAVGLIRD